MAAGKQQKNGQDPVEAQQHIDNLRRSEERAQEIHENILQEIADTSLQEGSKNLLRNLLTRDFVLANLTDAEVNEFKWKLRKKKVEFFSMHPGDNCLVVGEFRAAVNDDPTDTLRPLSDRQKWEVRNVFDGVWMRITRSKKMKQQEMLNTQIRQSKVDRGNQQSSGGIRGWLQQ